MYRDVYRHHYVRNKMKNKILTEQTNQNKEVIQIIIKYGERTQNICPKRLLHRTQLRRPCAQ